MCVGRGPEHLPGRAQAAASVGVTSSCMAIRVVLGYFLVFRGRISILFVLWCLRPRCLAQNPNSLPLSSRIFRGRVKPALLAKPPGNLGGFYSAA